ncbi:MAG: hypothetical protein V1709_09695 [Planctomycetota bacterium]
MNIKVTKYDDMPSHLTGGEYSTCDVEIYIDPKLPLRTQRGLVIHAVIEIYFPSLYHSVIEEIEDLLQDALDQLEEKDENR